VRNQGKWTGKFEEAMGKMGMFGGKGEEGMVDCTGALPGERKIKREVAF
jgi:L-ascorbate peroxidase